MKKKLAKNSALNVGLIKQEKILHQQDTLWFIIDLSLSKKIFSHFLTFWSSFIRVMLFLTALAVS